MRLKTRSACSSTGAKMPTHTPRLNLLEDRDTSWPAWGTAPCSPARVVGHRLGLARLAGQEAGDLLGVPEDQGLDNAV